MSSLKSLCCLLLLWNICLADHTVGALHKARHSRNNVEKSLQDRSESSENSTCTSKSCYRYYNSKTAPYLVESLPDVDFEFGEMYSGSVPIDEDNPNRNLFFIYKPAAITPVDEVTIWLQGGPGCSSLEGFFQENGPILWQPGTQKPVANEWAWSQMTNMLWVEQPIGTGFSEGVVTAIYQNQTAKDFAGFFKNWQKLFGIKDYKIYLTGESYAGKYIPYIGAEMIDQKDTTYYDLKGAIMYDPCIGDCGWVQYIYPAYYWVLNNNQILNVPPLALQNMSEKADKCGFNEYVDKYLQFPPPGPQPPSPSRNLLYDKCDVFIDLYPAQNKNPCYNTYHIVDTCPSLYDPLEDSGPYFNRLDVKKAIHAPRNISWYECSYYNVYHTHNGGDKSPNANLEVLPRLVEATNRVLVSHGQWDANLLINGTLLVIQNTTWNGAQGFQEEPSTPFHVPLHEYGLKQGVMGIQHNERGLQWVESFEAGHMQPLYQPRATYLHLAWMLGRIDTLPDGKVSNEILCSKFPCPYQVKGT